MVNTSRFFQFAIFGVLMGLILFGLIPLLKIQYIKMFRITQTNKTNKTNNLSKCLDRSVVLGGISVLIFFSLSTITFVTAKWRNEYKDVSITNMVAVANETQKYLSYEDSNIIYYTQINNEISVNKINYDDCKIIKDSSNYVIKKQKIQVRQPSNEFLKWVLLDDVYYEQRIETENYQYEIHTSNTDMIVK